MRRSTFACLAALAVFLLPAGPGRAAELLEQAATREGHVVWYTTLLADEAAKPLTDAFRKKYPAIDARFVRRNSAATLQAIEAEAKKGARQADVFDGTTTAGFLMKEGLVSPYKAPSWADIPARYKDPNGYWTAQVLYFQTVGYNSDLVPPAEVPRTYEDLFNPRWRGHMAWSAEAELTGGLGFIANVLMTMGQSRGMAYLSLLSSQKIARVTTGLNGVTLALAAKQFPLGLTVDNHHIRLQQDKGAHLGWVKLEPLLGLSNNIGLVERAPHPNAAKLFIGFILSEEGQTVLRKAGHIPASAKVEALDPSLKNGFRVNYVGPAEAVRTTEQARAVYNRLFR